MEINEELFKKLVIFSKIFIWLWENKPNEFKEFSLILREDIKLEVKHHKLYPALRKFWQSDTNTSRKEKELESFSNEILGDFYFYSKEWLKKPEIKTFLNTNVLIDQKISEILSKETAIERAEWLYKKHESAEEESIEEGEDNTYINPLDEKIFNTWQRNQRNIKDDLSSIFETSTPPSFEDKKIQNVIDNQKRKKSDIDKLINFLINEGELKIKKDTQWVRFMQEVDSFKEDLYNDIKNNAPKLLEEENNSKSIYQIKKEKNLNEKEFRRLLYTLKIIKFPITIRKIGKYANEVHGSHVPLFEKIYPQIKIMWKYEDNYKAWIVFFKGKMRWEKSRVSKFMKRRMESKTVPVWWFDICPPPISPKFLLGLINRKLKLGLEFDKAITSDLPPDTKFEEIYKFMTHQGIKKQLKEDCLNVTRALLTS